MSEAPGTLPGRLPFRRAAYIAALMAVITAVVLWIVADVESTGSRLSLSLLGGMGGLIFGALVALVLWDEAD